MNSFDLILRFCRTVYRLFATVVALILASTFAPAHADWEQETLTSRSGRPLFSMVTRGDLVMGQMFAGASLFLQCFDGTPIVLVYAVEPFFTETPVTVRYSLDTKQQPPEQWFVSEGRNSIAIGLEAAKSFMRSLVGHQRLRIQIPIREGGTAVATFPLGRVQAAVEAVAAKCGWKP